MSEGDRRSYLNRALRKQRDAMVVAVLVEIPLAVLLWPYAEWQPWIVGFVGTTVLILILILVLIERQRSIPPREVG